VKNIKYAIYFLLMLLLAYARILDGIRAFDIGLYIGLIYAGENMAILSPLFIIALFIASPSLDSLILSGTVVLLLMGVYFISYKLRKRVSIIEVNIAAVVARIPVIILSAKDINLLTDSLITLVISSIFTYAAVITLYAVIKRGVKNRMTQDELACLSILIIAAAAALYNLDLWGFMPFFTVMAFIIPLIVYNIGSTALLISFLCGTGAALVNENFLIAAAMTLCAAIAMIFRRMPFPFIAGAYLIADIGAGLFFSPFGKYQLLHIIAVVIGLIAALIIPPKLHEKIRCETRNIRKGLAARAIINMNRYELATQIASVGKAFNDIEVSLKKEIGTSYDNNKRIRGISEEIKRRVCGGCERLEECHKEDGDTQALFSALIQGAIQRGRATLIDVPPLITGVCRRVNKLTENTTAIVKSLEATITAGKNVDRAKILLAEQSSGIAALMNNLALKTGSSVTAEDNYEERIIENLAYRNVVCSEVLLWSSFERGMTLIVRQSDREKKAIDRVLFSLTGMKWKRSDIKCDYPNGMTALTMHPATQYEALSGECMATKTGSIISGDTRSITHIGQDKVMIALCDGMGSGERAEYDSSTSIQMIENLYTAGFSSETVLNLINSLLSKTKDESFSAIDLVILDIENGYADFIKLGAVNSFIRCENGIEVIEGGALPLGIVEEMKPVIKRRKMTTGELCVIVSDGVIDTIGATGIEKILVAHPALNPQLVANEIIRACYSAGINDDVTAIAFRLYRQI
jgi:stage II sporulation protein E